ncbi:HTH_Tnp_Tc3_2 domain-containing protein [Trichonephila clavipes]|nr:HTH_Tnp_Tc3_2 domain-containing protein [Trichonephila clavipes]
MLPERFASCIITTSLARNIKIDVSDQGDYCRCMLKIRNLSVMHRLWEQFLTTDSASQRFSKEIPCATRNPDDRYLLLYAQRNRTGTSIELRSSIASSHGRLVLRSTMCQRLHERSLYAR